jgi:hypothetical protein
MTYDYFINKFAKYCSSSTGVLWDNHETAGESKTDYLYLHCSYVCRSYDIHNNILEPLLIEPKPVFLNLVGVLKNISPNISALDYQLLLDRSQHTTEQHTSNNRTIYIIHQYIHLKSVYNFLSTNGYILTT